MNKPTLVVLALIETVTLIILRGLALLTLWTWFIVQPFHLPELSLPSAIGLMGVIHFFTYSNGSTDGKELSMEMLVTVLAKTVSGLGLTMMIAWIVKCFL